MGSEVDNNDVPDFADTGAVFTFGASGFADNLPSHFFIRNDPIIDMACGEEHTMVICQNGRLFGFGGNEFGQVGLGHKNIVAKPSCVKHLKPEKVKLIACGRHHSIACTESDNLYGWGNDSEGQLGIGENYNGEDKLVPTKCDASIEFKSCIKQVAAGSAHSVALTDDGNVYVWGSNQEGQLGLGDGIKRIRTPSLLPIKDTITQIACGLYHTLLLSDQGQIFVFGEGDSGKLGLGGNNSVPFPIPLSMEDLSKKVISISAGGNYSMALTEDGGVYAWGENEQEQLGFPREEHNQINRPSNVTSLSGVTVKQIVCGHYHTAFISDENELFTCGDMHYGKLCSDGEVGSNSAKIRCALPFKVSKFKGLKVEKVACGGKHTMVLASPEKLLNSIIPNGYSDHVVSSIDQHHNKNGHISNLELPKDRELISPPPAKTVEAPLIVPVMQDSNEFSEQNSHSSNDPSDCISPRSNNRSPLNHSPSNTYNLNHNNNINDKHSNKSLNHMEVVDVISEDSLSTSSKTDETVSIQNKHNYHNSGNNDYSNENNCVNNYNDSRKNSPPKINKLTDNYFQHNLALKIINKDNNMHNEVCNSAKSDNLSNENKEKNSVKYFYRNKDEINEFHDFDDSDDDDDDDDDYNANENNNESKNDGNNFKNVYKCDDKTFWDSEQYVKCQDNRFENVHAIEEFKEEDDDVCAESSMNRINNTNYKYVNSNFTNDWNNYKTRESTSSVSQCLFHNKETTGGIIPRIICLYEQKNNSRFCCNEDCKKHKNIKWFKDNSFKRFEEQKHRRKIIEHWLEENEFQERKKDRRENKIKIKCDKTHRNDVESRNRGDGDVFKGDFGKGGNNQRGGIINHFQKHSSLFQLKSMSGKKSKNGAGNGHSTGRTNNLDSSDMPVGNHQNLSSRLKEAKSDFVITRIFGHKRCTKSNNYSEPIEVEQNGSNNDMRNGDCSENNNVASTSADKRRNCNQTSVPRNGTSRGYQKNSKMCLIL